MSDDKSELEQPLIINKRDVTKIPCFRSSILYGVGSGVGAALIVFMFTSKPRWASHTAVATFVCVNLGHWFVCRHRYAQQKFNMGQIQGAYQKALILDGSEKGKKIQTEAELVDV